MNQIRIIDYSKEHQPWFEKLNRAWIEKYFSMEPRDIFVLSEPEEAILKHGGAILVALYNGEVAGVVALKRELNGIFEFTKMAVDETYRRLGIAEALTHAALARAISLEAKKVILYSHSSLKPAIALYKKVGFRNVKVDNTLYIRPDVKMEIDLEAYREQRAIVKQLEHMLIAI